MATSNLSPELRAKLDEVVHRMVQNGEPDSAIQFVVDDFKKKYASAPSDSAPVLGDVGQVTPGAIPYSGGATFSEKTGLKAAANFPVSAARGIYGIAKGLAGGLKQSLGSPLETIGAVGGAGIGLLEQGASKLGIPTPTGQIPKAQALEAGIGQALGSINQSYGITDILQRGDLSKAAKTATENPFQVGLDVLSAVEGGAVATRLGKAGAVTEAAATAVRPMVRTTGKAVSKVTGGIKDLATGAVGASTGAGKAAFDEIFTQKPFGSKPISQVELVGAVREGAAQIASNISSEYRTALQALKSEHPKSLELTPLYDLRAQKLADFGVAKSADGALDFSRSSLVGDEARVQAVNKLIDDWGTKVGDRTAAGIDILKQQIRSFKKNDGSAFDKFAGDLANGAKDVIIKSGDEKLASSYNKLLEDYGNRQDFLAEVNKTLGGNEKLAPDQAITKLNGLLAENRDYRRQLAESFRQATGKDIVGELAKQRTSSLTPLSLSKQSALLLSGGGGFALGWNVLPLLALTSPRIMAALFRTLGFASGNVSGVLKVINEMRAARGLKPIVVAQVSSTRDEKKK